MHDIFSLACKVGSGSDLHLSLLLVRMSFEAVATALSDVVNPRNTLLMDFWRIDVRKNVYSLLSGA